MFEGLQFTRCITDDAGRRVHINRMWWHRLRGEERKAAFESMNAQPWRARWTVWFLVFLMSSLLAALVALVLFLSALGALFVLGGIVLMPAMAFAAPFVAMELCRFEPYLRWIAERRISQGRCGACSYTIQDVSESVHGCTVCPECGAAWKLPSADTPEP